MTFKDSKGNIYYIEGDVLYVRLPILNLVKIVARLTYNTISKKVSFTITRKSEEKYMLGYLIPIEPFRGHFDIERIVLIEDNHKVYYMDYDRKCFSTDSPFAIIKPTNGYEDNIVIPDVHWHEIGELPPIDI